MYLIVLLIYMAQSAVAFLVYFSKLLMLLMTCEYLSVIPRDVGHQLSALDVVCLGFAGNCSKRRKMDGRVEIKAKLNQFIRFYSDTMQ